jgi:hypothetical protein
MLESCYCGRTGEIEDREPIVADDGRRALRCPGEVCGHLEYLEWLPEEARQTVFERAGRKQPAVVVRKPPSRTGQRPNPEVKGDSILWNQSESSRAPMMFLWSLLRRLKPYPPKPVGRPGGTGRP